MHKHFFIFLVGFFCMGSIFAQAPNGFYVGEVCELDEANIVYYNTPLKIQVDKPLEFRGGQIHSSNNRNDLHRVSLEVKKVPANTWLILKIDESYYATCLREKSKRRNYGSSKQRQQLIDEAEEVTKDTSNSKGGFVIEKRKDAEIISKFLKVDIIDRKHFGHKLEGELKTRKASYARGDSILLDFSMTNVGQVPVALRWDDSRKQSSSSINRLRFQVVYKGKKLVNKKKKDPKTAYMYSVYLPSDLKFKAGDRVGGVVDLRQWFDFDGPGEYFVSWTYRMQLKDTGRVYDGKRSPEFFWDDEVVGRLKVVVE